jgi:ubiquinone/menaquinone biosynthesis C-methylase UbiE
MDIPSSYDSAASAYAEHLFNELESKPLDRHLLDRFAEEMKSGRVADLGCGPGHVAKYLSEQGVDAIGIDISPGMIRVARSLCPNLGFEIGDMTALKFDDASLDGIVSFYSIVHLRGGELAAVFTEWRRALKSGGFVLVAFHLGTESHHVDDMWGRAVSLDFQFHETDDVARALTEAGFVVLEVSTREPYKDVEYQSRRSYILARAS